MTEKDLQKKLNGSEVETLSDIMGYFDSLDALKGALGDELDDYAHEIADGRVSVYTGARLEWLMNNYGHADQEEAIACGAKTADEIAAWCWYASEKEDIMADIEKIQSILDEEE